MGCSIILNYMPKQNIEMFGSKSTTAVVQKTLVTAVSVVIGTEDLRFMNSFHFNFYLALSCFKGN